MLAAFVFAIAATCQPLPTCAMYGGAAGVVTNCASPTPVLGWDENPELDLAGYYIYERENGLEWHRIADVACWWDSDDAGAPATRHCIGSEIGIPIQRSCVTCAPFKDSEYAITAYDAVGNESTVFSDTVLICFSPICSSVASNPAGACN